MGRVGSILISVIVLHLLKDTAGRMAGIVTRSEWGSSRSDNNGGSAIPGPVGLVFIHHTAGPTCSSKGDCASVVRGIQRFHIEDRGWDDIGYSFLVGQDGSVYEGRGWGRSGAHTYGYNSIAYGIAIMGNFEDATPSKKSLTAVKVLLNRAGKDVLTNKYKISGHKDVRATLCPGKNLYPTIRRWSRYTENP